MFLHLTRELAAGQLGPFDAEVAGWLTARRGCCDAPMFALTWFGAGGPLAITSTVIVLWLFAARRRWEAAYLAACVGGAALICSLLKLLFQRPRPDESLLYFIATPASFSFPSGHAMGVGGFAGGLVVLAFVSSGARAWRVAAVLLGLALALGVASSRVYFGVHYPSDVAGGLLASTAWVAGVTGWFFPPNGQSAQRQPTPVPTP
jgi:undecaprenyl-diphosphatase